MQIPEKIQIKNTMHGSGAKGMSVYGYEDTGGLGIRMEAKRKDRNSPFIETWFLDALPDQAFKTFKELRDTALPLTDEQIVAETAYKYPLIRDVEPDSCGNKCRLCPREVFAKDQFGTKYDTWRVTLMYSWKDGHSLSLCDKHMEQFGDDAKSLKAAVEAEVAERRNQRNDDEGL